MMPARELYGFPVYEDASVFAVPEKSDGEIIAYFLGCRVIHCPNGRGDDPRVVAAFRTTRCGDKYIDIMADADEDHVLILFALFHEAAHHKQHLLGKLVPMTLGGRGSRLDRDATKYAWRACVSLGIPPSRIHLALGAVAA